MTELITVPLAHARGVTKLAWDIYIYIQSNLDYPNLNYPNPRLSALWSQAKSAGQGTNIGHDINMHMCTRVQYNHRLLCLCERQLGPLFKKVM